MPSGKWILLLVLLSSEAFCQSFGTEPPKTRPVLSELVRAVRRPLVEKLQEVQNSFLPNEVSGRYYFTSVNPQVCPFDWGTTRPGSRVVEVFITTRYPDANSIDEQISYSACGAVFLIEHINRKGTNLKPTTVPQIFQGQIPLELTPNMESIDYRLTGFGETLFEMDVHSYQSGKQVESRFRVQGREALTFLERFDTDRFIGQYEHGVFNFTWTIAGTSFSVDRNDRLRIIKEDGKYNPLYFAQFSIPISEREFASRTVQWTAEAGYFQALDLFFRVVIGVLPETEQASLGIGQNQQAIDKFTQLIVLLQTRAPVNVETVLNELISIRDKLRENEYTCEGFE